MKIRILLLSTMILAGLLAWADPVIEANVDSVQFGQVDVGYPVSKIIRVTGSDLEGNINLAVEARFADEYSVSPKTITPEDAARGVFVQVKYRPSTTWSDWANLVLTSENAADLEIPITADPQRNPTIYGYNNQRSYSTHVGKTASSVEVAYFADAEVPTDPNQPVVRCPMNASFNVFDIEDDDFTVYSDIYQLSIEGDDCFSAKLVRASSIANTCTVRISYNPMTCGTHHAVLNVTCSTAGAPLIVVNLDGEALPNADVDGNGEVSINDLSSLIDFLLDM